MMRRTLPAVALALSSWLSFTSHGWAHAAPVDAPAVDAQPCTSASAPCPPMQRYAAQIRQAETDGMRLYRQDTAAWLTTDALRDAGAFAGPQPGEGAGWLTEDRDNGTWVGYFRRVDGHVELFAEATLARESREVIDVRQLPEPRAATPRELHQITARTTAMEQQPLLCTNAPFNTVIWDAAGGQERGIEVFLLSSQTNDHAPFGGFHRYLVSRDGRRVLDAYSQTRGCLAVGSNELARMTAITLTHLTSDAPTAFHVFMSLTYDKPVLVVTGGNDVMWAVDHGAIREVHAEDPIYPTAKAWYDEAHRLDAGHARPPGKRPSPDKRPSPGKHSTP